MSLLIRASFFFLCPLLLASELAVTIKADDLLRFSKTRIEAKKGQTIVLTFINSGKMASQKHNFVLLKPEAQIGRFGDRDSVDGIPDDQREHVIVSTPYLKAGESKTLRIQPLPPGRYTYICAFPGHHTMSRGTLIVQ